MANGFDGWSFGGPQLATGAMASTDKINGQWIRVARGQGIAWTPRWTGTPTGAFSVEGSNEYDPKTNAAPGDIVVLPTTKNWTDPAGSASKTGIDIGPTFYSYVRLCYTNAGGAGALAAKHQVKSFG